MTARRPPPRPQRRREGFPNRAEVGLPGPEWLTEVA